MKHIWLQMVFYQIWLYPRLGELKGERLLPAKTILWDKALKECYFWNLKKCINEHGEKRIWKWKR